MVDKKISEYMAMIGRKGGLVNKKKGSAYFRKISLMRKKIKKSKIKN
jgi:hypothetical protein